MGCRLVLNGQSLDGMSPVATENNYGLLYFFSIASMPCLRSSSVRLTSLSLSSFANTALAGILKLASRSGTIPLTEAPD